MTTDYSFTSNSCNAFMRCPASLGSKTNIAKPHLERWIYVKDAIEEWLYNDAPDVVSINQARNRYVNELDAIQTKICDELFETFRSIYPKTKNMSMSRDYPPVPRTVKRPFLVPRRTNQTFHQTPPHPPETGPRRSWQRRPHRTFRRQSPMTDRQRSPPVHRMNHGME